jgi:hypothetical protein
MLTACKEHYSLDDVADALEIFEVHESWRHADKKNDLEEQERKDREQKRDQGRRRRG